jgi:hypothetical protein
MPWHINIDGKILQIKYEFTEFFQALTYWVASKHHGEHNSVHCVCPKDLLATANLIE